MSQGTDSLKSRDSGCNLYSLVTFQASVFCGSKTIVLKFSSNWETFLSIFFCADLCLPLMCLPLAGDKLILQQVIQALM